MNELVANLVEKVGISEDQARSAIELVVSHRTDKQPDPIGDQLEGAFDGDGPDFGGMAKGLGGMFGN